MTKVIELNSLQETMDFVAAIECIIDGYKITKLEWANKETYGLLKDGKLMLHLPDGFHDWIISDGDLNGEDYIVVNV